MERVLLVILGLLLGVVLVAINDEIMEQEEDDEDGT